MHLVLSLDKKSERKLGRLPAFLSLFLIGLQRFSSFYHINLFPSFSPGVTLPKREGKDAKYKTAKYCCSSCVMRSICWQFQTSSEYGVENQASRISLKRANQTDQLFSFTFLGSHGDELQHQLIQATRQ